MTSIERSVRLRAERREAPAQIVRTVARRQHDRDDTSRPRGSRALDLRAARSTPRRITAYAMAVGDGVPEAGRGDRALRVGDIGVPDQHAVVGHEHARARVGGDVGDRIERVAQLDGADRQSARRRCVSRGLPSGFGRRAEPSQHVGGVPPRRRVAAKTDERAFELREDQIDRKRARANERAQRAAGRSTTTATRRRGGRSRARSSGCACAVRTR